MNLLVAPEATPEEAAAIVAAHEALWPRPMVVAGSAGRVTPAWRFSGRWWTAPVPSRRIRPRR